MVKGIDNSVASNQYLYQAQNQVQAQIQGPPRVQPPPKPGPKVKPPLEPKVRPPLDLPLYDQAGLLRSKRLNNLVKLSLSELNKIFHKIWKEFMREKPVFDPFRSIENLIPSDFNKWVKLVWPSSNFRVSSVSSFTLDFEFDLEGTVSWKGSVTDLDLHLEIHLQQIEAQELTNGPPINQGAPASQGPQGEVSEDLSSENVEASGASTGHVETGGELVEDAQDQAAEEEIQASVEQNEVSEEDTGVTESSGAQTLEAAVEREENSEMTTSAPQRTPTQSEPSAPLRLLKPNLVDTGRYFISLVDITSLDIYDKHLGTYTRICGREGQFVFEPKDIKVQITLLDATQINFSFNGEPKGPVEIRKGPFWVNLLQDLFDKLEPKWNGPVWI